VARLGGQLRVVAGPGGADVIGWDLGAALALARALGVCPVAAAEWLPHLEAAMVRAARQAAAGQP
jgi:hypothetical protein